MALVLVPQSMQKLHTTLDVCNHFQSNYMEGLRSLFYVVRKFYTDLNVSTIDDLRTINANHPKKLDAAQKIGIRIFS